MTRTKVDDGGQGHVRDLVGRNVERYQWQACLSGGLGEVSEAADRHLVESATLEF